MLTAKLFGVSLRLLAGLALLTTTCIPRCPGSFDVSITRSFQNAVEQQMITTAEAACPIPSDVEQACGGLENPAPGCRWWCGSFDGVFIPFAITCDAIEYYSGLVYDYRQAAQEHPLIAGVREASFAYSAEVAFHEDFIAEGEAFEGVYVVSMTMSYSHYCGPLCGMGYTTTRTVVLDSAGVVLRVIGDGEPGVWVS